MLGALDGLTDVAMNSQAVELQRRVGTSIITRFHAAVVRRRGDRRHRRQPRRGGRHLAARRSCWSPAPCSRCVTVVAARWLLPDAPPAPTPTPSVRRPAPRRASRPMLVRLFLVGMAIALAELPPNDWSALMMSERFDVTAGQAGLGFVAVAGGMLVGRLIGDRVDGPAGPRATRRGGAALAAAGVVIATTAPVARSPPGAGCSSPGSASRRCSPCCSAPPAS